jgi:hypothetical protein
VGIYVTVTMTKLEPLSACTELFCDTSPGSMEYGMEYGMEYRVWIIFNNNCNETAMEINCPCGTDSPDSVSSILT